MASAVEGKPHHEGHGSHKRPPLLLKVHHHILLKRRQKSLKNVASRINLFQELEAGNGSTIKRHFHRHEFLRGLDDLVH